MVLGFPGQRHRGKNILPVRQIMVWSKLLSLEELHALPGGERYGLMGHGNTFELSDIDQTALRAQRRIEPTPNANVL